MCTGAEKPIGRESDHKSIQRIHGSRDSLMVRATNGPGHKWSHVPKGDISVRWDALASGMALSTWEQYATCFSWCPCRQWLCLWIQSSKTRNLGLSLITDTTASHTRICMSKAFLQPWLFSGLCKIHIQQWLHVTITAEATAGGELFRLQFYSLCICPIRLNQQVGFE